MFAALNSLRNGPSPRVRGSRQPRRAGFPYRGSIPACAGKPSSSATAAAPMRVHPRVCGEALAIIPRDAAAAGPSPRVRGSLHRNAEVLVVVRSIPACAGKPTTPRRRAGPSGVHPRVCGEASGVRRARRRNRGPSPRVRGSPRQGAVLREGPGSIPACAGKPRACPRHPTSARVHPRVCGEAPLDMCVVEHQMGPSPRVRGSREGGKQRAGRQGSIPACAGKPRWSGSARRPTRVHPRVCGEASATGSTSGHSTGPSPRVRGSPVPQHVAEEAVGSIPACAGKPLSPVSPRASATVHPRVCGEALRNRTATDGMSGPSPRVRGSRSAGQRGTGVSRSIPACAGKPLSWGRKRETTRVHPRVCGEAGGCGTGTRSGSGPSPRVRGSRPTAPDGTRPRGSIPACAGKPFSPRPSFRGAGVHPRVCGEAASGRPGSAAERGPSPRVRGSPTLGARLGSRAGSIPACAGKPFGGGGSNVVERVHPRVCGEAIAVRVQRQHTEGPSPRVRGSHAPAELPLVENGSIPACAGKPLRSHSSSTADWVHPRVCGEAAYRGTSAARGWGPSPRVRGSPELLCPVHADEGSIPACAGKPARRRAGRPPWTVHPRVCGEAWFRLHTAPTDLGPSPRVRGSLGLPVAHGV